jgi:hypothetical protein
MGTSQLDRGESGAKTVMKIFGTWLPFIGYRRFCSDERGFPLLREDKYVESKWYRDFLMVEWFNHGLLIFTMPVSRVKE